MDFQSELAHDKKIKNRIDELSSLYSNFIKTKINFKTNY